MPFRTIPQLSFEPIFKDPNAMLNLVAALVPGKRAAIQLRRDSKELEIKVAVGKRPAAQRRP